MEAVSSISIGESVAEASYSEYIARIRRIGFNRAPQAADMDVHGAGLNERFVAPDAVQELIPAIHPAGMADEKPEQFEFTGAQFNGPAVHRNAA